MSCFIGIDLGTTNSVIASYDGGDVRVWKSPDQTDVTPSAIHFDKRGNKRVGVRAYSAGLTDPGSAATLFKRLMGTSTPVTLPSVRMTLTPEQCSAEVLKVLFSYLPEEMRNDPETGTVITVPAAFNHMQKDATLQAAELAGVGKVAIMQEPVAAVMSVMRARKADGIFIVYDLGGGTLDVAVAESLSGHVSLMAHGGIAMCGGRDFDRLLLEEVVARWLKQNFDLPDGFLADPAYSTLALLGAFAAEKAKIELSSRDEARVGLSEAEVRVRDRKGTEIYLDVPLRREELDKLIALKVEASIDAARETLRQAGLSPGNVERLVFVGGPTQYKPLRDRVVAALGVPGSTEVNPMTAVAEGAAIFAESIDWSSARRGRKSSRGALSIGGPMAVSFAYVARTPDVRTRIAIRLAGKPVAGAEFQVDCLDTGWSSGRLPLRDGTTVDVSLSKAGNNTFKVFIFDGAGGPMGLEQNRLVVSRVAASVDGIPASHSMGIEVLEKLGGRTVLDWLVRAGESLPKKGKRLYKTSEALRAGGHGAIRFKLWEGDIEEPISDNTLVGALEIRGTDIEDGRAIAAGADLICEYEISDSGNGMLEVSVPSIGAAFHSGRNFYSRQEGQIDFTAAAQHVADEASRTKARIQEVEKSVDDPRLEAARKKVEGAAALPFGETDPEVSKQALDDVLEARKLLSQVRKGHLREIRTIDLDSARKFFEDHIRELARPSEVSALENLFRTAQRSMERDDRDFENLLADIRGSFWDVLWRQDWFVVERFKYAMANPIAFVDRARYAESIRLGEQALKNGDVDRLREAVTLLGAIGIRNTAEDDLLATVNILRG